MCFGRVKIPEPKPAPAPPDPNMVNFDAVNSQRRALADSFGRRDTILTRLKDEDVAATAKKKTLGAA